MRILFAACTVTMALSAPTAPVRAQGSADSAHPIPEVDWFAFDDGIMEARTQNKHIMVDVYTDWCGWCKKLDKETYTDHRVREVLADSYVSVKLKGDSGRPLKVKGQPSQFGGKTLMQFLPSAESTISESDLTRGVFRITSFPTILFLSSEGRMITKLPGYHNAASFVNIINFIKDDLYEVMSYDDYLKSLEKANEATGDKS